MKRILGRTQLEVFPLGLGGHTYSVGDRPDCFATPEWRARLVASLVEGGVNYFDTTWLNEVSLLADSFRRAGVGKDAVVSLQHVDGISDGKWREKLRGEVEARLRIMNYSCAPLFLMGVGNNKPPLSEIIAALEAMARLRDEGLIRFIGVSCHELGHFPALVEAIERTDLIDYMMIRFNWKCQQANEGLFEAARKHGIGVVAMKVFCWDCGPYQWGRRISVFEPTDPADRDPNPASLSPAQQGLIWALSNSPAAVAVPAINAEWEAQQCLGAMPHLDASVDTSAFGKYAERLWSQDELSDIADKAESRDTRERARVLLAER